MLVLIGRKTPRTPRAFTRGHATHLYSRARNTRRRVGAVAPRMGSAEKGVLQVRASLFPLPCHSRSQRATDDFPERNEKKLLGARFRPVTST